jgi:hypothetical protein
MNAWPVYRNGENDAKEYVTSNGLPIPGRRLQIPSDKRLANSKINAWRQETKDEAPRQAKDDYNQISCPTAYAPAKSMPDI